GWHIGGHRAQGIAIEVDGAGRQRKSCAAARQFVCRVQRGTVFANHHGLRECCKKKTWKCWCPVGTSTQRVRPRVRDGPVRSAGSGACLPRRRSSRKEAGGR